jgi:hypothetical protein
MQHPLIFENPYRPGAGHMPPYVAGRKREAEEFDRLLAQRTILSNLVLTGIRGVGKTVLLETFKPRAQSAGWLWVGNDLSESVSVNETNLAVRIITDLAVITASVPFETKSAKKLVGFHATQLTFGSPAGLSYEELAARYKETPGLVADKIKAVLEFVWLGLKDREQRVIFAYDEAQNLSDHAERGEYPLSVLLDVFQSIQRKGIPFMLVLTGLPTLFPKLVEARTFSERMFRVVKVDKLSETESRDAILKPLEAEQCPVRLVDQSVVMICEQAGGYPYFIQFLCREVYDILIQQASKKAKRTQGYSVPIGPVIQKLDGDFFAGRWAKVTDRQRELLWVIATVDHADEGEFTIQEIVAKAKETLARPFSASHVNQILVALSEQGLIYKDRLGKYSFAVPLMGRFIRRNYRPPALVA